MTECIAFEGTYRAEYESALGKTIEQVVFETVIGTPHGVAHFKVCQNVKGSGGKYPSGFLSRDFDTHRYVTAITKRAGWHYYEAVDTADLAFQIESSVPGRKEFWGHAYKALCKPGKAQSHWGMLTGSATPETSSMRTVKPFGSDHADLDADRAAADLEAVIQAERDAMIASDDGWGMF